MVQGFLVLRRKPGESVIIGGRIEVKVLSVEGNRVKLGFIVDPNMRIVRKELLYTEEERNVNP